MDREKRLQINILELKAVSLALQKFKDQFQNQTVLVATDNSNVVAYINKQGGTHSAEMCALLWKFMTWCHHYKITLRTRHIPGFLNVIADLLSRSNQMQSTEWSLHPQVFKQIYQKWFTPHVDLFATRLNHKQSHNYVFHSNPQHLNLQAWCLGVDSSKNKASLWRWQRELLPLRCHQQEPSINQSGPYLKNGAEKIRWISPLPSPSTSIVCLGIPTDSINKTERNCRKLLLYV